MPESTHDKLSRVRKPHVHITYKVHLPGGDEEVRELPFVVGVMGDFTGQPSGPVKPLRERDFVNIDRDNFNEVMRRMAPAVSTRVPDTLSQQGGEMAVQLKFESMDDFQPAAIARQVEPLKKLLEMRELLKSLLTRADGGPELETLLESILQDADAIKNTAKELGLTA